MWFSGVTWPKCLLSSCAAAPEVSRLSIATPTGKSTVSWSPVRSSIRGGSGTDTTMSSISQSLVLPPSYAVSK